MPVEDEPLDDFPGYGSDVCRSSYAARVKPNWGDDRRIRAGPPLKKALNPSSLKIVLAACVNPVYDVSPFRASTCSRVLITSNGVVKYAAGIPAIAPAVRSWKMPSFFVGDSWNMPDFRWAYVGK